MQKLDDTVTNESRKSVQNIHTALYRANKLYVLIIFERANPENTTFTILDNVYPYNLYFKTGTIMIDLEYDHDIENITAGGIFYFKTMERAYYDDLNWYNINHTDEIKEWLDDGTLSQKYYPTKFLNITYEYSIKKYDYTTDPISQDTFSESPKQHNYLCFSFLSPTQNPNLTDKLKTE
ncbi:MAG: hypothetical protein Gaeavirus34_4 [Gaeavirus sp.]|uniref:Uncharacterized protein n=1 Tax=Gaeavirus sp. TaxID=2487767 RepID=A0A3G5A4E1_9VIRU|nr:MAG: hypothetical protein Gaeavirus34_4 [Gaeavirus sp.]